MLMMIKNVVCVLFFITIYIDHVVMGWDITLNANNAKYDTYINAKCSQIIVSFLSLMNPWLYLLNMKYPHPCYFTTPQDVL
jgi:hypothetical protein